MPNANNVERESREGVRERAEGFAFIKNFPRISQVITYYDTDLDLTKASPTQAGRSSVGPLAEASDCLAATLGCHLINSLMHYFCLHSINKAIDSAPLFSLFFLVAFRKMLLIQFYFNLIATLPGCSLPQLQPQPQPQPSPMPRHSHCICSSIWACLSLSISSTRWLGPGNGNGTATATATAAVNASATDWTDYFAPLSILYNIFALIYIHGISFAVDFDLFPSSFLWIYNKQC